MTSNYDKEGPVHGSISVASQWPEIYCMKDKPHIHLKSASHYLENQDTG